MRISTTTIVENSLLYVSSAYERLAEAQQKISTGRRVSSPSDDPGSIMQSLSLRSTLDNIDQYQRNIEDARGFLVSTDSALERAATLMRKARTTVLQSASNTLDQDTLRLLANEVGLMYDQMALAANSMYGSRYLFSGQRTNIQPFADQGNGYVYQGGTANNNDEQIRYDIGPLETITVNITGDRIFTQAFEVLRSIQTHIANGETTKLSKEDLQALDQVLSAITNARAEFGAKMQQVNRSNDQLELTRVNLSDLKSKIEDADMSRVVIDLKAAEITYQAALAATARGFQQSLVDYLR
jgi:flagellar hook-associated protein 3 FlgL